MEKDFGDEKVQKGEKGRGEIGFDTWTEMYKQGGWGWGGSRMGDLLKLLKLKTANSDMSETII